VRRLTTIIKVYSDGSTETKNVNQTKEKSPQQPRNLKDIWQHDRLSYKTFRGELARHKFLDGNKLKLKAKQVRALYRFLEKNMIVKTDLDMTDVFACFAGSFELRFGKTKKTSDRVRSLQSIPDLDAYQEMWTSLFSSFVSSQNEIKDEDK
jgi:hypothetical protein